MNGRSLPGPHEHDGFWVSFWTYVEADQDRILTTSDCSAMLLDLHEALRSYPGELPLLGADDIPRGLELLGQTDEVLSEDDAELLCASAERLRSRWQTPREDAQPLHGDAHLGNLSATRRGEMVWIDFEDVCLGPVEWDLATMMDESAVAKYPDPELLVRCTELRALCLIVFSDDFGDMEGWDEGIRSMLNMLAPTS